ncbi:ABC transporter permease [Jeotgalibaca sp. MA1X17-3]|uniref:ABC transporter permease n=1 Tax=Jeotgalibaca sp. MA1X17-3 TaxID=2908211 RepID=UPI001F3535DB|nr:ABC transporter permease [Jeotgalibaca sp. MA1X17-3]UJF16049.1 ABC transporter permease [Jeotgalibaca sp. MA1X17-3]
MIPLIKRHIKLFLKDKASVFFSFLSVFIIVGLYILFLSENIASNLPEFNGRAAFIFLWMFAGIVAVTTATAPLGALGKFIEDEVSKKSDDLLITKISRRTLAYSYVYYSFIIGFFFTSFLFIGGFVYTWVSFDLILPLSISLLALLALSTFMHTLLFYLVTARLKTMSAFSGFSTLFGALIGFLAGIYVPIGSLPSYLQKIVILFPTTQVTVLLRNILMDDVLSPIQALLPNEAYEEIIKTLGVQLAWDDQLLSSQFSWIYLLAFTLILLVVVLVKNRRKNNVLS